MHLYTLEEKIKKRELRVGIIGLGYVGIPLALVFVEEGYHVTGFEIDATKVEMLNNGKSYIQHISNDKINHALKNSFRATLDYSKISDVDAIIICVPTPLTKNLTPDLSYIQNSLASISKYLKPGQIISLESTTYPGTTEEILTPFLSREGYIVGDEIFVVFSPEREDPGRKDYSTKTIPKVVGGVTTNCLKIGSAMYNSVVDNIVQVSSPRVAEMTKLLENIHRAVNIGLVNEMKLVCDRMNINIHEVIEAAATKPFGFVAYRPGPGLGGHCIPIDPFYLTWKAKELGLNTKFIELAGEINNSMPEFVTQKINFALNKLKKSINGSRILLLGVAYKKNIDDYRESPVFPVYYKLSSFGAVISVFDPFISEATEHGISIKSINSISPEIIQSFDCIVLLTDHDIFDYNMILNNAATIVDTRGIWGNNSKVIIS
jgi:UDP-N-acetyl-D-glucosamine dehydrogenase